MVFFLGNGGRMKTLVSKLLCIALIMTMVLPYMGGQKVYASDKPYHIQLKTTGVMPPVAKTSPVELKIGEKVNIGAEVADSTGNEVGEEDWEFGDFTPIYERIKWTPVTPGIIELSNNNTTVLSFTGLKAGETDVVLSYDNPQIEGLTIHVNVTSADIPSGDENKVLKLEAPSDIPEVLMGEEATLTFKAKGYNDKDLTPQLKIKEAGNAKIATAAVSGDKLTVTGVSEGFTTMTLCDETNEDATVSVRIKVKDPNIFDFDDATGIIKGFKDKTNNPTEVVIPDEIHGVPVKGIGREAFKYSSFNTKVKNRITKLVLPNTLETIDYMGFQGNNIELVRIPDAMTVIGERAFYGNTNLEELVFGEDSTVTEIGRGAFQDTGLSYVSLPDTVKKIDSDAFSGTLIYDIELPEGLKEIGGKAFAFTPMLYFNIPSSVEKIGLNSRGKLDSGGLFFRSVKSKTSPGIDKEAQENFVQIFDDSGKATVENTKAIVNPVNYVIKYQDAQGTELAPTVIAVGQENYKLNKTQDGVIEGDKHLYTNFLNPFGIKVWTNEEIGNKIIGENYFILGKEYTINPIEIDGWETPAAQKVITTEDNESTGDVVFVYTRGTEYTLSLEGEGLESDQDGSQIIGGRKVKITITEPDHKELSKVTVAGKNVTDQLTKEGFSYTYTFTMDGDTTVKVEYAASEKSNTLELRKLPENLKLGDQLDIKGTYRGEEVSLSNGKLEILPELSTFDSNTAQEGGVKVDEATGKLILSKAGNKAITVALKTDNSVTDRVNINIKPIKVFVRMEDDEDTVLDKTEITIDSLELVQGVDYYKSLSFKEPVALLAIDKALKEYKGINTAEESQFNCGADGNWMKILGPALWKKVNPNGSYMFYVNNVAANFGVGQQVIKDGDSIVVYYDPDWRDASKYGFFTKEDYTVAAGEDVELALEGSSFSMTPNTPPTVATIEGGRIFLYKDGVLVDDSHFTKEGGKVKLSFKEPGTYIVHGVSNVEPAEFSRAFARIVVAAKEQPVVDLVELEEKSDNPEDQANPKDQANPEDSENEGNQEVPNTPNILGKLGNPEHPETIEDYNTTNQPRDNKNKDKENKVISTNKAKSEKPNTSSEENPLPYLLMALGMMVVIRRTSKREGR